jgi:hypothetical protein
MAALVCRGYRVMIPFGEGHPFDLGASTSVARLSCVRHNQRRGIRFAAEFELDRWSLDSLRALVQADAAAEEALAPVA